MTNIAGEIALEMSADFEREDRILEQQSILELNPDFEPEPQDLTVKIFGECIMENRLAVFA